MKIEFEVIPQLDGEEISSCIVMNCDDATHQITPFYQGEKTAFDAFAIILQAMVESYHVAQAITEKSLKEVEENKPHDPSLN